MQPLKKRIFHLVVLTVMTCSLVSCSTTNENGVKESRDPDKQLGLLRIYLEIHEDGIRSQRVQVLRSAPFEVVVDRNPILTEANLDSISVKHNELGMFIELQADRRGSWLLESYTATNTGRRLVISAAFPEMIWLAAPIIRARVADGVIRFAPDATVEEAKQLEIAVMNSIRKIKNLKKPKVEKDSDGEKSTDEASRTDGVLFRNSRRPG